MKASTATCAHSRVFAVPLILVSLSLSSLSHASRLVGLFPLRSKFATVPLNDLGMCHDLAGMKANHLQSIKRCRSGQCHVCLAWACVRRVTLHNIVRTFFKDASQVNPAVLQCLSLSLFVLACCSKNAAYVQRWSADKPHETYDL